MSKNVNNEYDPLDDPAGYSSAEYASMLRTQREIEEREKYYNKCNKEKKDNAGK